MLIKVRLGCYAVFDTKHLFVVLCTQHYICMPDKQVYRLIYYTTTFSNYMFMKFCTHIIENHRKSAEETNRNRT